MSLTQAQITAVQNAYQSLAADGYIFAVNAEGHYATLDSLLQALTVGETLTPGQVSALDAALANLANDVNRFDADSPGHLSALTSDINALSSSGGTVGFNQQPMGLPKTGTKTYTGSPIFYDKFDGTSLKLNNWWPRKGAGGVWNNKGTLPCPYTGANTPLGNGQWEGQVENPGQISVNNGLSITLVPNPNTSGPEGPPYVALSGAMTNFSQNLGDCTGSTAQNALPSGGWFAQILAKQPDMQHGITGNFWFLETGGGGELDVVQGCFGKQLGATGSEINFYPMACGPEADNQAIPNVGVDASLAFHKYSIEYIPGVSMTTWFDDEFKQTWTTNIPVARYEVLIHCLAWIPAVTFATTYDGGTGVYEVAEVAVYAPNS